MKVLALAGALTAVTLWCSAAAAQQLPRFSIEATCRHAQPLTAEDRDPVQGCIRDETDAQRQLPAVWGVASPASRDTCAAETKIGGPPSYVELLTCLQMYEGGAPAAPPRRRREP